MATDSNKDLENLRKDFESLRNDLASLTENIKASSSKRAQAGVDAAREQFDQTSADLADEIAERPFTTVFAAFGLGFILAKLLDR